MKTASFEGNLRGTYTYNGYSQLIKRVVTNTPLDNGTAYYLHDRSGNVIAELDQTGTTAREYIWLPEAGYAGTDMPLAVVDGVNTASPQLYYVHTDHINRPIRMSTTAKVMVWQAEWNPWGGVQSLSGALANNLRFLGQWFQIETGLHYNWHRHYDPTIGRYTQPDPLGFVDGPSVWAYAGSGPQRYFDPDGRQSPPTGPPPPSIPGAPWVWRPDAGNTRDGVWQGQDGQTASWDFEGGHWDIDDGHGNRQRYNRHGAPISADEAHGEYKGPPRFPFPPRSCPPTIILPPDVLCRYFPQTCPPIM